MTIRILRVTAFALFLLLVPIALGPIAYASPLFQEPAPLPSPLAGAAVYLPALAKGLRTAGTPTPWPTITGTATVTQTATQTATPAPSGTPQPSITPTGTVTVTITPATGTPATGTPATGTPQPETPTIVITPTITVSPTPSDTPSETPTGTPVETATPAPSETPGQGSHVLVPFDGSVNDLTGPTDWASNYGKTPELIAVANGTELDVLAQDYDPATAWTAVLLHIRKDAGSFTVTEAHTGLPMLDGVMGLAADAEGNRYYATAVDEGARVSPTYPPPNTYRSDIVRVVKVDPAGNVLFNIDLDPARHAADGAAEMIVNPMVAATARLAIGGGEIALVHGINTGPDPNLGGQRHQKALSTRLGAADGSILATATIWVSHSFDQRLLYDGTGIVEYHLGDAFPRHLAFGRNGIEYPLFHIKGLLGENLTATRLGNLARIENDPAYGYLALFATESTATLGSLGNPIAGPRNLAIVRVHKNDNSVDPNLPDALTVTSVDVLQTNKLRWLTGYTAASQLHAERPKLVALGGDRYVVLWEQWQVSAGGDEFQGVYGLAMDAAGNTLAPAALLTNLHHLPRGDDAFLLDGRAAWLTGDAAGRKLDIHLVDAGLGYQRATVALP